MASARILRAALNYRRRGWSVIPLRSRSKQPLVTWKEFEHRLAGESEIARWFGDWPDAEIGLVGGSLSRLAVLDIDAGCAGPKSLKQPEAEHGALPKTVLAESGGGGRHFYFSAPATTVRTCANIYPGIHLRAEGSIIIAPPSTHPNGRRYHWISRHSPQTMALAQLPLWLQSENVCTSARRDPARPARRSYMKPSLHV